MPPNRCDRSLCVKSDDRFIDVVARLHVIIQARKALRISRPARRAVVAGRTLDGGAPARTEAVGCEAVFPGTDAPDVVLAGGVGTPSAGLLQLPGGDEAVTCGDRRHAPSRSVALAWACVAGLRVGQTSHCVSSPRSVRSQDRGIPRTASVCGWHGPWRLHQRVAAPSTMLGILWYVPSISTVMLRSCILVR